jgi:hypothetical protein
MPVAVRPRGMYSDVTQDSDACGKQKQTGSPVNAQARTVIGPAGSEVSVTYLNSTSRCLHCPARGEGGSQIPNLKFIE